ncbi:MAG: penicillin acylase family protein [Bacteroidales bacterium]
MKKILISLSIIIVVLVIAGLIILHVLSRKGLPDYNENISLANLKEEVIVYRDSFAIPHVYAKNEHDLYLATGYILAQDRLWQMDLLRRVTLGRLSEIFGSDFKDTDLLLRALRYSKKSEMLMDSVSAEIKSTLYAFAEGVNQYITSRENDLPLEFKLLGYQPEPWEPIHSLNLIGYMAWDLKAGWNEIVLEEIKQKIDSSLYKELLPDLTSRKSFVFPEYTRDTSYTALFKNVHSKFKVLEDMGLHVFTGSNNWAVSGRKSITGKPLLANDMHLSLNTPGIWYQIHQHVEGRINVTGLLLPGQPLVIVGHNDSIAWGMTNTYVDNLDFYEEKIHPDDSTKYLYNDKWLDITFQPEIILTKEGETIKDTLKFTHRGAIVSRFKNTGDKAISMHWTGDEYSNEMRTIYLLNRAKNWKEFKNALTSFKSISQNIAYADAEGNIGLFCAAGIPIRNRDEQSFILPGWTDKYDWQGMVPFDKLPYSFNPPNGYVSSANNKTVPEDYPYYIGQWYSMPYRIDRIREMLEAKEKLSISDFREMQNDKRSLLAEKIVPRLLEVLKKVDNIDDMEQKVSRMMEKWKSEMKQDTPEPLIFEMFYLKLKENIFSDELGKDLYTKFLCTNSIARNAMHNVWNNPKSEWYDDVNTSGKENMDDIIYSAFMSAIHAIDSITGEGEPEKWQWGKLHTLTLQHPLGSVKILDKIFDLNRGPYRVGGSTNTVCPFSFNYTNPFIVNHGASHRSIYSTGNWNESITVIPTGNSGIVSSKHYCDQTSLYLKGMYHTDYYDKNRIEASKKYVMTFSPDPGN